ncbi:MAG: DUF4136 domain-containing protein [Gemmatimonadaceae bacterium]|nr:DUF4136 domain-containing protein [Gemmatimonadaceae bacterium]
MACSRFERSRRHARAFAISGLIALSLALGACGSNVQVRTLVAPDANLSGRRTFQLLRARPRRDEANPSPNDPMLANSITYRRIRARIRSELEKRGYQNVEDNADMDVAYYATTRRRLEVRTYDYYGYRWRPFPRQRTEVTEYTQGTVVVDIVDPGSHDLLWRGMGRAPVSEDPERYAEQLEEAVDAIIAKFPESAH